MHIEEFVDVLSETELFAGLDDDDSNQEFITIKKIST